MTDAAPAPIAGALKLADEVTHLSLETLIPQPYALLVRIAAPFVGIGAAAALFMGFVHHERHVGAQSQAPKIAAAQGAAAVAAGQGGAQADAAQILDAASQRLATTLATHQENARAISAAPGADAPLDPRLNDAGRRGLCRFSAYAGDPDCAGLLQPDPGQLPQADPGRAASGG